MSAHDERLMRECLRLARRGRARVGPNPMVGAILARDGRVMARGWHRRFGGPHAEVECLRRFRGDSAGVTLYVNLEPCSHHGKTPPCADLIAASGVPRVVVAMKDPNPLVNGRGIRRLRRSGLEVTVGVLEDEARELNRVFITSMNEGRPYVHVKIAQSLDGMIARVGKGRRWISSLQSRKLVHRWRAECDAVLVGAGTVRADNPRLDVRLVRGKQPAVVILDGRCATPVGARVFSPRRRVILCVERAHAKRREGVVAGWKSRGAEVLTFKGEKGGRIALRAVLRRLRAADIGSILVEGGRDVFTQFLASGMVDELSVFMAPVIIGRGIPAVDVKVLAGGGARRRRNVRFGSRTVGRDLLIHATAE